MSYWRCEWCGAIGADEPWRSEHVSWHIRFLIAEGTDLALTILEEPIPVVNVVGYVDQE